MSRIVTVRGISASAKVPSGYLATPVNCIEYRNTLAGGHYVRYGTTEEPMYTIIYNNNKTILVRCLFSDVNYS